MNTKDKAEKIALLASDATFQISCDKDCLQWLTALMRAIQTNIEHCGGSDVKTLVALGQYVAYEQAISAEQIGEDLEKRLVAAGGEA